MERRRQYCFCRASDSSGGDEEVAVMTLSGRTLFDNALTVTSRQAGPSETSSTLFNLDLGCLGTSVHPIYHSPYVPCNYSSHLYLIASTRGFAQDESFLASLFASDSFSLAVGTEAMNEH